MGSFSPTHTLFWLSMMEWNYSGTPSSGVTQRGGGGQLQAVCMSLCWCVWMNASVCTGRCCTVLVCVCVCACVEGCGIIMRSSAVFGMGVASFIGKSTEVTRRKPAVLHWHPSLALEQEAFMYPHNMFPQLLPSYLEVHCDTVPKSPDCRLPFMTAPEFVSIHQLWPPHWCCKASFHYTVAARWMGLCCNTLQGGWQSHGPPHLGYATSEPPDSSKLIWGLNTVFYIMGHSHKHCIGFMLVDFNNPNLKTN